MVLRVSERPITSQKERRINVLHVHLAIVHFFTCYFSYKVVMTFIYKKNIYDIYIEAFSLF